MAERLPEPVGAGVYNVYTGRPDDANTGRPADGAPLSARLGLEPPRFCARCGRKMVVQVRPDGWWARCSRHGLVDSKELELRR